MLSTFLYLLSTPFAIPSAGRHARDHSHKIVNQIVIGVCWENDLKLAALASEKVLDVVVAKTSEPVLVLNKDSSNRTIAQEF